MTNAMDDPRTSGPPEIVELLQIWDSSAESPELALEKLLCLPRTQSNEPRVYGWSTAIRGRVEACRGATDKGETLLAEALGHLYLADDMYGFHLVQGISAIAVRARDEKRAKRLIHNSLQADVTYCVSDLLLLRSIAGSFHFSAKEYHLALLNLSESHRLLQNSSDSFSRAKTLANLCTVLMQLREYELARAAVYQACAIVQNKQGLSYYEWCSTAAVLSCRLAQLPLAKQQVLEVLNELGSTYHQAPNSWVILDNIAEVLSKTGEVHRAYEVHSQAKEAARQCMSEHTSFVLRATEPVLLEGASKYDEAIICAKDLLQNPPSSIHVETIRELHRVIARCYNKEGNATDAAKWERRLSSAGLDDSLNPVAANKLRRDLQLSMVSNPLTSQELACLRLAARGQSSIDIGLKLGIKARTVNFHFSNIFKKLGALNRQEATAKAAQLNLLDN